MSVYSRLLYPSCADIVTVSATWPESVRRLASSFLNDPVRVTVGSDELTANKRIEQVVEVLDDGRAKECALGLVLQMWSYRLLGLAARACCITSKPT